MIRICLILVVMGVFAGRAAAQTATLSGTVVDQTGASVPGAAVTLAGSAGTRFATPNAHGEYAFVMVSNGTYTVTATLAGFVTAVQNDVTVGAANVEVPALTLYVASVSDTVVVTATKSEVTLLDTPATMSVISSEVLATTVVRNFGDLLRSVPGVNAIQLSARDVNVTIRQGTGTVAHSMLVLVDGRPINLDFLNLVLWDFIPANPLDIKQIEVIRGPASAVWGTNAMTGVANIITKLPREAPGTTVSLSGGFFDRQAGSTAGKGVGTLFGANVTVSEAPNDTWSYRVSGGYFHSDPLPRPTGTIPLEQDPRDPTTTVGGALYPADASGAVGSSFLNTGTSQPKFDARVDQEIAGGHVTYEGGVAGTSGIFHTGVGPFDIQKGSYAGYGRIAYRRRTAQLNVFTNVTSGTAPNLLLTDPATLTPLQLNFSTQTYDADASDVIRAGSRQVFTVGGNVRRNNFDITIAPTAQNLTDVGTYLQDEVILNRVRLTLGARVDKFGNVSHLVFSPRLVAVLKPAVNQSVRLSFNRAFRAPSSLNNYQDINIVVPTDLSALAPLLPPELRPAVTTPFPLVVGAVGSQVPINGSPQKELTEESVTAYEIAYTGTFGSRTTVGVALYLNDVHNYINFSQLDPRVDPYTSAAPPPGWQLPVSILDLLAQQGIFLPRTALTYLNLGPLRQKGIELSVDHRVSKAVTAFANYSWQAAPEVLDDPHPFPVRELTLPPTNRFNLGLNMDGDRLLAAASVNYSDNAFWSDVLSSPFFGFTDAYTMVNATFGVKWSHGRITTLLKATNLLNQDIQQHVFGDIVKRSVVFEARFAN